MNITFLLYHVAYACIAVLLAQSLTVVWRARLFSLGHHAFQAVGAYAGVVLAKLTFPSDSGWFTASLSHRAAGATLFVVSAVAGSVAAAALGAGLGRLLSRVRGDYFAVATLIVGEIVRNAVSNWTYVGGAIGFDVPYLFVTNESSERLVFVASFAAIGIALNVALFAGIRRMDRSVFGLWIDALRDDDVALETSGVDVVRLQTLIFALAAGVAGLAGVFFLHLATVIVPQDFSFLNGLPTILYVVLGGLDRRRCVIAAIVVYVLYELFKLQFFGLFGASFGAWLSDWRELLWGIVLILAVVIPAWKRRWTVAATS